MAIEIVDLPDLPMNNEGFLHRFLYVYQYQQESQGSTNRNQTKKRDQGEAALVAKLTYKLVTLQ